ncbi:MAG TPA: hypothetical protein VKR30_03505 [Candidatus Limnocylindrales bacterium]|nr:hypothetical protein [Candidatus Limnocylindrales bacterium]
MTASRSGTRTDEPVLPVTRHWRPMAFGFKSTRRIHEPICEPLWGGERVFVEVAADGVRMRDVEGEVVAGFDPLHDAIADSSEAEELLLDGYVLPAPLGDLIDQSAMIDNVPAPSVGQMTRQFVVGNLGQARHRDQLDAAQSRVFNLDLDEPAAFVAVDLLWLDGVPLLDIPLGERKRLLDTVIRDQELVRRSAFVHPPVEAWYRQWRAFGFREIAVKDANSRYVPGGESDLWTTATIPRR